MAIVSHRIAGLDILRRRLSGLPDQARAAAAVGLDALASAAADAARADLASRPGPSAPGSPPADHSGRIAAGIGTTVDPDSGRAAVTVAAPQARFLEYGTTRMPARPFLRPAASKAARGARAMLGAALRRGLSS